MKEEWQEKRDKEEGRMEKGIMARNIYSDGIK